MPIKFDSTQQKQISQDLKSYAIEISKESLKEVSGGAAITPVLYTTLALGEEDTLDPIKSLI